MQLRFHGEALLELDGAVTYLEAERPGFGELFYDMVVAKVALAKRLPQTGARASGTENRHDVSAKT